MRHDKIFKAALLTALCLLLGTQAAFGQSKAFKNFYDKYSGHAGVTTMQLSGTMIVSIVGEESSDYGAVSGIWMITEEHQSETFRTDLEDLLKSTYKSPGATINESGSQVDIYTRTENKKVVEILLVVRAEGNTVVLLITGSDLDINQVSKIAGGVSG